MRFLAPLFRRGGLAALLVGLVMATLPAVPAVAQHRGNAPGSYVPVTGPTFNRPIGSPAQQMAIFTHLNSTIDSTPGGATIRFAVFSYDQKPTTDKLIAAYRRGVKVQIIIDSHAGNFPQVRRLAAALGTDPTANSFVLLCQRSCRGTGGNMHDKFFTFSRAGGVKRIVMTGSNNLTGYNARHQWSDVYTAVGNSALMTQFRNLFLSMVKDEPVAAPYIIKDVPGYQVQFFPYPKITMDQDPIYRILNQVQCVGATGGAGTKSVTTYPGTPGDPLDPPTEVVQQVTRLSISMHAWLDARGRYLASKIVQLHQEGCNVRVVLGKASGDLIRGILTTGGVPFRLSTRKNVHVHEKYFTVSGVWAGNTASKLVWTGSHNWVAGSLNRDEVLFRAEGGPAMFAYQRNFKDIWANG